MPHVESLISTTLSDACVLIGYIRVVWEIKNNLKNTHTHFWASRKTELLGKAHKISTPKAFAGHSEIQLLCLRTPVLDNGTRIQKDFHRLEHCAKNKTNEKDKTHSVLVVCMLRISLKLTKLI